MTIARRTPCTLALAAAVGMLAVPVDSRAAVVQSGPVSATFGSASGFDPTSQGVLTFDTSLGTLDTVTLTFDGTVSAVLAAQTADPAPYPSTVGADVTVYYTVASGLPPFVGLPSLTLPLTVSSGEDGAVASASGSAAEAFQLAIPAVAYGGGVLYTDDLFTGINTYASSAGSDAIFTGTVTDQFDYIPSGTTPSGVPEPSGVALVSVGLIALAARRRRA